MEATTAGGPVDDDADQRFAAFVAREHPRLVGALSLYTGDAALAEELASEALTRAAARWSTVDGMDRPGAWVHRVAINLANSWFRRVAAARRAEARHGPTPLVHDDPDVPVVVAVRDAVAALPRRQRAAVVLHHFSGWSTEEAAAALGVAPATVRSNLRHARARLRAALLDHETPDRSL